MHERQTKIEGHQPGYSSGSVASSSFRKTKNKSRAGFAIAPILYMLGLIGVGAAVLFSGYSQILRTNSNITNGLEAKNDLNGNATTMAATSVLGADQLVLCPPTAAYNETTDCSTATTPPPVKLAAISGQTQLPANTAGVSGSGGTQPREVGVFTAGSGMKQLDPWGHYYIVCRWESLTAPGSAPAFMIISGGPDGSLQTKCTDTAAQGDDLIIEWPVTVAVNRSAVWQSTTTSGGGQQVQFGQVGQQLTVDSSGDLTVPGFLAVNGASTLQGVNAASIADSGSLTASNGSFSGTLSGSSLSVTNNGTIGGTLGVTGATSLGTLSTSGVATLNSATISGNTTVGGTLGVTGASTLGSLAVTTGATVGGTLGVTGDTNLASTLETGGLATLNSAAVTNNASIGGTLGVTGATSLSSLTTTGNTSVGGTFSVAGISNFTGVLNGSSAVFSGNVQAANFIGTVSGGSISWGSTLVPLANGGSGYAASSTLDLLNYLGGTNASNLTLGTLPSGRIAAGEITSAMMAAPDVGSEVGPYYQVYVDSAGRVVSGSSTIPTPNSINDGAGESITADSNGLTFDTSNVPRMRINMNGNIAIGTTTAAVSLDLTKETDAIALPDGTTAQRPTAGVTNGDIRYNSTLNNIEAYVNGAWSSIVTSGGSGTTITSGVILGTSASATNPQRASDVTTGLFSPVAGTVSVASSGSEIERASANGVAIGTSYVGTAPPSNGAIIQGNVGIGTSTVANSLDVNGSLAVGGYAGTLTGANNELIVGGNVGIGTASPTSLLHVVDSSAQTINYNSVEFAASATSSTTSVTKTGVDIQSTGAWNGTGATNIGLNVNATGGTTNYAALFNGGNVGIGTAVPGAPLQVRVATDANLRVQSNSGVLTLASYNDAGSGLTGMYIYGNSLDLNPAGGGKVAIGTTSPQSELDVYGGVSVGSYGGTNAAPSNGLIVSGSVGIGTATPANKLDVDGSIAVGTYAGTATGGSNQLIVSGLVGIGSASPQVTLDMNLKTDAVALPSGLLGQRPAGINGEIRYSQTSNALEAFIDGTWENLLTSGGSTSVINLGTSATTTNPQRNGEAGTGLFSATSGTVSIAGLGSDIVDFSPTGENLHGTITQGSYSIGYKINGSNAVWEDGATNQNLAVGITAFPTTNNPDGSGNDGQLNTAVGYSALNANTTGYKNTAVGDYALSANTTGHNNTAVGETALQSNTTGIQNTAVGYEALQANKTGQSNTAVGYAALFDDAGAGSNVAVGAYSLEHATTGGGNTAVGYQALQTDTTGSLNVALGQNALLSNLTGVNNTALGYQAGYDVTTGGHNVIIGDYATTGVGVTSGSNNILIGQDVRPLSQTGNNQLDIGNLIFATGLGSGATISSGLVGIGSTTPNSSLDISQRTDAISLPSGSTAQRPSSAVNGMIRYNSDGGITTAEGYFNNAWQEFVTTGSGGSTPIYLGTSTSATNPQRNGDATTGLLSPAINAVAVSVGGTQQMTVNATGVGIGTTTVSAGLQNTIAGAASQPGELLSGAWYTGGTATTTKPQLLIEPAGTTSTGWSTGGTAFGVNAPSAYAQTNTNLMDLQLNGSSKLNFVTAGTAGYQAILIFNGGSFGSGGTISVAKGSINIFGTPATNAGAYLASISSNTGASAPTSGDNGTLGVGQTFAAASGTGTYANLKLGDTINQTGSASGIARGLWVAPTLTSAVDYRGVEIANTSGHAIYQTGSSAPNYFAGKVGIGSTSPQVSLDMNVETDAVALPSGLLSQRPAGINGEVRYSQTDNALEAYVNGAWEDLITNGGSTSGINLGTSATATNPHRTGDVTTGLFSDTVSTVEIAAGGTQQLTVNGTGVGIGTSSVASLLTIGSGTPTTAANGIQFGTDTSADLYRSAAGGITTDATLNVGTTIQIKGSGNAYFNATVGGTSAAIEGKITTSIGATNSAVLLGNNSNAMTYGSGTGRMVDVISAETFSPTSGTGILNTFELDNTINQTGTATGVTRGIYFNQTLTSAYDYRAIETAAYTQNLLSTSPAMQQEVLFNAPTLAAGSSKTVTTAATEVISGAPIAGSNVTITNPYALDVQGGTTYFGGAVTIGSATPVAGNGLTIAPGAAASGTPSLLTITGPADTGLTASTEANDVNINLNRTVTFATGNIGTQRAVRIQAPTYAFAGASTITSAATVDISGAPVAGSNATITNPAALVVESGNVGIGTASPGATLDVEGPSLASGNLVNLASTSTAATSNTQTVLNIALSGANATSTQSTYGEQISNTHTGTSATNYGLYSVASGATNNYGVYGSSTSNSTGSYGVLGSGAGGAGEGVYGSSSNSNGVHGFSNGPSGVGVMGEGSRGTAGYFEQDGAIFASYGNPTLYAYRNVTLGGNAMTGAILRVEDNTASTGNLLEVVKQSTYDVVINNSGSVGIGNTSPGAKLDIGSAGATEGTMRLEGSTSGYTQIQPNVTAGNWVLTLPSSAGSPNYILQTDGSGNTSWVALGGSGTALNLGTSATATNPQRSGQAGTGLFSATSNTVSVADNGADVMDIGTQGPNILGTITQGSYSIGYQINGSNAVWQDVTNFNTAVGATALPTTNNPDGSGTDGQENTATGYQALNANATGYRNTAIGSTALKVNTTGFQNTAVGAGALVRNTTGSSNVAVGDYALEFNTTGIQNTALGHQALASSTLASNNVAIGYAAMNASTTGQWNTAVGTNALRHSTTGNYNVTMGYNALFNNVTGQYNTTVGFQAGNDVTSGSHNLIVGDYNTTGVGITTGSNNILIGQDLQELTQTGSNQLDIGNLIFATGLSSATTLSTTGNVGIGSTSPQVTLDLSNRADALALPSGLVAARPAGLNGEIRYSQTDNALEAYVNGAWEDLITSGGTSSSINLGTSTGATNPHRTGDVTTGLFSASTGTVSIAAGGSDIADFTSTGESVTGNVTASTSVISPTYTGSGAIVIKPGSDSTSAVQIQTSGGSNILDVDTTNSHVGIGTATPSINANLEVYGSNGTIQIDANAGNAAQIIFNRNGLNIQGRIAFLMPTDQLTFQDNGAHTIGIFDTRLTTSGVSTFTVIPQPQTIASAAGATYTTSTFTPPTITLTGTTHVTGEMDSSIFNPPTIADASAVTVDNAATLTVTGAPVQAGSVTLANSYGLKINAASAGSATNAYGLYVGAPTGATNNYAAALTGGSVGIGTTAPVAGNGLTIAPSAVASGTPSLLTITGPADTGLTASTEANDVNINLNRTVTFATGAIATQRAVRIQAPTYAFAGASTITNAATVDISGPPVAGSNATITNPAALIVESGNVGIGTTAPGYALTLGSGQVVVPLGSVIAPSYAFATSTNNPNTPGLFFDSARETYGTIAVAVNGSETLLFPRVDGSPSELRQLSANILSWSSNSSNIAFAADTGVSRGAAGTVYIGNGTAGNAGGTLIAGNVGIGNTSPGAKLDIGSAGATEGTMRLEGSTSGYTQVQPNVTAGNWILTLPSSAGSPNYILQTDGSGNTSWVALGGSGTALNLGTSATATNPQRSGQAGTGLFSATSNTVSIADNGADVMDVSTTGPNILGTITQGSYSVGYQINGSNAVWQDTTNFNLAVGATAFPTTVNPDGSGNDGQSNTAVGYRALQSNTTGYFNTAVGAQALVGNTTGIENTAIGYIALAANTTGGGNTAVGYSALNHDTTGQHNTAIGQAALFSNTIGASNVAVGASLQANTTGSNNTAVGFQALATNTTGYYNTAVGTDTLQFNNTGQHNTAMGYNAMLGITGNQLVGSFNTGIGDESLLAIQGAGANNTTLGYKSGFAVTTGTDNTLLGYEAGLGVTGNGNIIVGEDTNSVITSGGNNIVIGQNLAELTAAASNQLDIGNLIFATGLASGTTLSTTGNVGIGSTAPQVTLDLSNRADALALPSGLVAARPAGLNGEIRYSQTDNALEAYVNGAWEDLITSGGTSSSINLGTAVGATNPHRTADVTTGLFSDTVSTVEIAAGGTEQVVVNGTGVGIGTSSVASLLTIGSGTPTTAANGIQFGTDTTADLYRSAAGTIKTDGTLAIGATTISASQLNTASGGSFYVYCGFTSQVGPCIKLGDNNGRSANTTFAQENVLVADGGFSPSSGSGYYSNLEVDTTINQTGTATGIVRDLYLNPTLTSAYDFRGIEVAGYTNNLLGTSPSTIQEVLFNAPTLAAGSSKTVTTAATEVISGAPIAGSNVTITNSYALDVQGGTTYFGGAVTIGSATPVAGNGLTIAPAAAASGTPSLLTITGPADTGLTASTESNDVNINLNRTVTFATGNITNQRAIYIQAPTYAFGGASTITNAATVDISGPPVAGSNATITNPVALAVENGPVTIGTTVPTSGGPYILTVKGASYGLSVTGSFADFTDGTRDVKLYTGASGPYIGTYNNASFSLITNGNGRIGLDTAGNVGLGGTITNYSTMAGANVVIESGKMGIVTTSPNALLDIGSAGATEGTMRLEGSTSGYTQIQPNVTAGSWTMTLPSGVPAASGYVLSSDTSGNTSWVALGGSGTALNLGTSATATNPQRSGQAGTGLFSATSNTLSIAANGADVDDFTTTGENLLGTITQGSYSIGYKINGSNAVWQDVTNENLAVGATGFPTHVNPDGTGNDGLENIAIGHLALNVNTTGYYNVAIGALALEFNTTGTLNTAVGQRALTGNTTGIENTALGEGTLYQNTTGSANTAVGQTALEFNTWGASNVAIGYQALLSNVTGSQNVGIGAQALDANTTGSHNTAVGLSALYSNTTGSNNTALGLSAGHDVNGGSQNIIIGYYPTTGVGITTGSNNILIGQDLQNLTATASNQLDIGNLIFATGLSSGSTLSTTGNVGIGSTSPQVTLDLSNRADALALPSGLVGTRPAGLNGELRYSQTDNALEAYVNGAWTDLITSGGTTSSINLGTSTGATNPHRTGDVTTGLFSASTGTVSIAAGGSDIADFTSTGESVTGNVTASTAFIGPVIKPASDSTSAVQIETNGGSGVLDVDTTNSRVGIGTNAPAQELTVYNTGNVGIAMIGGQFQSDCLYFSTTVSNGGRICMTNNTTQLTFQNNNFNTVEMFDMRTNVSGVSALTVAPIAQSIASASNATYTTSTFTPPTITLTGTTHVTSEMDSNVFNPPTITDASAVTVDNAATLTVTGAPVQAGSVTLANSYGIKINAASVALVTNAYGLYVSAPTGATNNYAAVLTGGSVGVGTTAPIYGGGLTIAPSAAASGTPSLLTITGPADTGLTASTEANDVNINLNRTVTFATGAIGTQRAMYIQAPTYAFAGASTITNAATVDISGPPVAGSNATITSPAALIVESGRVGIGTQAPGQSLHVVGNEKLQASASTGSVDLVLQNTNNFIVGVDSSAGNALASGTSAYAAVLNMQSNGAMQFATNNSVRATILGGGNFGIVTTSPGALLDIGSAGATEGTMRLEGSTSGYTQIQPNVTAGSWTMTLPSGVPSVSGYVLSSDTSGNTSWVANGSGSSINLGTSATVTNPQRSGQAGTGLFSATSNTVSIADNGADVMDVATTGPNILGTVTQGSYSIGYQINGNNSIWQDATNFSIAVGKTAFPTTNNPDGSARDGQFDVAVGYHAMNANTTGAANVAVGANALAVNTTGTENTALGAYALTADVGGSTNTAVGYAALLAAVTGQQNTAVGATALFSNTGGSGNIAIGLSALGQNVTGNYNTGMGQNALYSNVTGVNNTALGFEAGYDVNGGSHNIILGDYATTGVGVTTGSNNIMIGQDVRPPSQTASNQLNIGNLIYATGLASGSTASTGKVGIGTTAPRNMLDVYGGDITVTNSLPVNGWDARMDLGTSQNSANIWVSNNAASAPVTLVISAADVAFGDSFSGATDFEFYTNASGHDTPKMGIGTATPAVSIDASAETDAFSLPSGTSAQRPTPANGMIRYNQSTTAVEAYYGSAWNTLAASGGGSTLNLGTSATTTNPQRSGQAGTGFYSDTSNEVEVAINGSNLVTWSANGQAIAAGVSTGAGSSAGLNLVANSLTTGNGEDISSSSLTSGNLVNLADTSTAGTASSSDVVLNISHSGANANTAHTAYGLKSSVTNTNATSGTNIAAYLSASGATTANYGLLVANGTVGIGTVTPTAADAMDVYGIAKFTALCGSGCSPVSVNNTFSNGTGVSSISGATGTNTGSSIGVYGESKSTTSGIGIQGEETGSSNTGEAVAAVNNSSTGWSFFASGTSPSFFGASIAIITRTPGALLDIGSAGATEGTMRLEGSTSGYTQIQPNVTAGSWTMTLPSGVPSVSGYVLSSDTSGNTSWVANGSGSSINLGTSAAATNPQRSGQAGTGLFSATSNTVSIAAGGTDQADFVGGILNIPVATTDGSAQGSYQLNGSNAIWQDATNGNLAIGATAFPTAVVTSGFPAGQHNIAIGGTALNANTTGYYNIAIGINALVANTIGNTNIAIGSYALSGNTTGNFNVAMGYNALGSNSTGLFNTAIGFDTLDNNTTGVRNTALGASALGANTTGEYNAALGFSTLSHNTTGVANAALGYEAGFDVTTGSENIILGYYPTTGVGITTGSNNILIGYDLQELTQTSSNQLDIGNLIFATGLASGTTMSTGSVGIGTASPSVALQVYNGGYTVKVDPSNGIYSLDSGGNVIDNLTVSGSNTGVLKLGTGGAYEVLVTASGSSYFNGGSVGIGSTTPNSSLDLSQKNDAMSLPSGTSAQRPSGVNGMIRYNQSNTAIEAYYGSAWNTLSASGGGSAVNLGTSASVTNPQRTSDATTGLFSASTGTVSVSTSGTDQADFSSGGLNLPNIAEAYRIAGDEVIGFSDNLTSTIAVGYNTLIFNSANYNTAVGGGALYANTTAQYGTAVGYGALGANTTGQYNTAVGYQALNVNTTGQYNAALGASALALNTTGNGNTAVGYQALQANTTAYFNTALGYQTLSANTTGQDNTAVGLQALNANTIGYSNVAVGQQTLLHNTTGFNNTAIGEQTLGSNTTGAYNTAVGGGALALNTTGQYNTALGYFAGLDVAGGNENIIIGYYPTAGVGVTSGSNNIMMGYDVRPPSQTASNQLNIGNLIYATGLASGTTASTGNVGIGTNAPGAPLDVAVSGTTDGIRIASAPSASATKALLSLGDPSAGSASGTYISINTPASSFSGDYFEFENNGTLNVRWTDSALTAYMPFTFDSSISGEQDFQVRNLNAGASSFASFEVMGSAGNTRLDTYSGGFTTSGAEVQSGGAVYADSNLSGGLSVGSYNASGVIRFYTGGSASGNERVRINASGNVGIGSTSPNSSLDISQKTDAVSLPSGTSAQRPGSPVNGMIRYNQSTTGVEAYYSSTWNALGGGGGSTVNLGTSASVTNPQRTSDATTGFFSPATGTVATSIAGTEMTRVTSTGLGVGTTSPATTLHVVTPSVNTTAFRVTSPASMNVDIMDVYNNGSTVMWVDQYGSTWANRLNINNGLTYAGNVIYGSGGSVTGNMIQLDCWAGSCSANPTAGSVVAVNDVIGFNPTSGSATFASMQLTPIINQTGGASGISRGLYVNPTVTAAADFRALEVSTGKSVFGGSVGIGTTNPGTTLDVNGTTTHRGSLIGAIRTITAAGAVTVSATTDYYICVNKTSGAATTVNLPSSPATGLMYMIKDCKGDANTNNITIAPAAGTIDGASTFVMSTSYQAVGVIYNGSQWNTN